MTNPRTPRPRAGRCCRWPARSTGGDEARDRIAQRRDRHAGGDPSGAVQVTPIANNCSVTVSVDKVVPSRSAMSG
ncbi:MAG: hypothetical protein ACO38W_11045, partial [Phycisphaerales bacterium]